jgi:hypothetical protein
VDRYSDADAAFVARLTAELGGARIATFFGNWFEPRDGVSDDDLGALELVTDEVRVELQLWESVLGLLDTWLARRDEPVHGGFAYWAVARPRAHLEVPSEPVMRLGRELVDVWLVAAGHTPTTAPPIWRPAGTQRATVAGLRGRLLAFDAPLSQLMSEPLGQLLLLTR